MSDKNIFYISFLSCFSPDGRLDRARTWREIRYLVRFLSSWLITIILFIAICATPIVFVHSYLVPIPIALKIFGAFHIDPEVWEYNIEEGDLGDVGAEYEAWSKEQDFGKRTAIFWQYFLWYSWPFLFAYLIYIFAAFYLFIHKFCSALFARYRRKVLHRERAYYFQII